MDHLFIHYEVARTIRFALLRVLLMVATRELQINNNTGPDGNEGENTTTIMWFCAIFAVMYTV